MLNKLKPCPFCNTKSTNNGKYPDKIHVGPDPDTRSYCVICTQCGASTDWFLTEKGAVKAWNMRANNSGIEIQLTDEDGKRIREAFEKLAETFAKRQAEQASKGGKRLC